MHSHIKNCKSISSNASYYEAWSTVIRMRNGQLCLAFSGGRRRHVCPFGRLEFMQSDDNGQNWTWPRVIFDSSLDDRDGGLIETLDGSLLITTFSSDAYQQILERSEAALLDGSLSWSKDELYEWRRAHQRVSSSPFSEIGQWVFRSTDGGATWSHPIPSLVSNPHGPTVLKCGKLLYAGRELWGGQGRVGFAQSCDDGQSWKWLSNLPIRNGDDAAQYHELHAVVADNGVIIAHIRNWNEQNKGETLQSESSDGGKTWSTPHSIGVWGIPSHLLKLHDGRLMMTYGYRRVPFGNQARVSHDNGMTWSGPLIISEDGTCTDLGYPSTVQLGQNDFLTVWYERKDGELRSILRQAEWSIIV